VISCLLSGITNLASQKARPVQAQDVPETIEKRTPMVFTARTYLVHAVNVNRIKEAVPLCQKQFTGKQVVSPEFPASYCWRRV